MIVYEKCAGNVNKRTKFFSCYLRGNCIRYDENHNKQFGENIGMLPDVSCNKQVTYKEAYLREKVNAIVFVIQYDIE